MSLAQYYSSQRALVYHPGSLTMRRGLRRLVSFDDRFEVVVATITKYVTSNRAKILDIGVGDGVYERALLSKGVRAEYYGVDISQAQLVRAKSVLQIAKKVDLDNAPLPFPENFFDIIIASEILEHLLFPERTLRQAQRVLKHGGILVLTYPNSGALQLRLALLFGGTSPLLNYSKNKEHIRFFNRNDVLGMWSGKIVAYQGLGSFLFDKWNFPTRIMTPRFIQVLGNKFLPNLALGNLLVLQK